MQRTVPSPGSKLQQEGAAALVPALPQLTALTTLNMQGWSIVVVFLVLATAHNRRFLHLHTDTQLGPAGLVAVASSIAQCKQLQTLNLAGAQSHTHLLACEVRQLVQHALLRQATTSRSVAHESWTSCFHT